MTRTVRPISFSSNPHQRLIRFMLFEIAALLSGQKDDAKNLTRMTAMLDERRQVRHVYI